MESILQDIRFCFRWLRRSPGFTATVVLTLALGIGANTAIFSLLHSILLRPLPYPEAQELVRLWASNPERGFDQANLNPLDFADLARQTTSLASIGGFNARSLSLTGSEGQPVLLRAHRITEEFFATLGAETALGRSFEAPEFAPGGPAAVLISHRLWSTRFRSDTGLVGRSISINDRPVTVVGVMPASFETPGLVRSEEPDLWVPLLIGSELGRGGLWLNAVGRLAPGANLTAARGELAQLSRELATQFPDSNRGRTSAAVPLKDTIVGPVRAPLLLLLATVVLVLMVACANVANLWIARAILRQQEVAVRSALGASSTRLTFQIMTESVVLSLLGGAAGVLSAWWGIRILRQLPIDGLPRLASVSLDTTTVLFSLALTLVTGGVCGLLPALEARRSDLRRAFAAGGRSDSVGARRLPKALIVAEVALAFLLSVGAGLLIRSFGSLLSVDIGFEPKQAVIVETDLPFPRYREPDQYDRFYQRLRSQVALLPGVQAAALVDILPFGGGFNCSSFGLEGDRAVNADELPCAEYRTVSEGYFDALGARLARGRDFSRSDDSRGVAVAIVNETLASALWPESGLVGQRLILHLDEQVSHEVVGVVRDIRHFGFDSPAKPEIYIAARQHPSSSMTLVVRTRNDPQALAPVLREEVRRIDALLPVTRIEPLSSLVSTSVTQQRFRSRLLSAFAGLAVALAAVGIFGVLAFSINRRTQELGLRMALGADRRAILRMILRESMLLTAGGLALGLIGAVLTSRLMSRFLFGVSPLDPAAFGASLLLVVLVAIAAALLPATRASRLSPLTALRES